MDFDDTDNDRKAKSADEQNRIDGNTAAAHELMSDLEDDAMGRDGTNLAGSSAHRFLSLASTSGMSPDVLNQAMSNMYRALSREEFTKAEQTQLVAVDQRVRKQADEKREEEKEKLRDAMDDVAEQQKREQEEWAKASHSFGDVEMTGTEWGELSSMLSKDGPFRRSMIERAMRQGKSREEAEQLINKADRAAHLMNIPEGHRTSEERAELADLKRDAEVEDALRVANIERVNLSNQRPTQGREMVDGNSRTSVEERKDLFASAPDLTAHHQRAVAAMAPLDVQPPPTQIAAVARPAPQPDASGFAV